MIDTGYRHHADVIAAHIAAVPGYKTLLERDGRQSVVAPGGLAMILEAAAMFAERELAPLNPVGDREGCHIEAGRVRTPTGYAEAWMRYAADGWCGIDHPAEDGGQGLPFFVSAACHELFDRACMAFGMFDSASRGGARVLKAFAEPVFSKPWLEAFAAGRWAAAIGISEADAGSDVGRIRTRATDNGDGSWTIDGEKMWTSFGDHDMVERIGLFVLARTPGAPAGTSGLSLFLVPNLLPDTRGGWRTNGVVIRRLEEKLGLHGSPTCVTGLEGARGWLIGEPCRGLSQLFVMLQHMRVSVAVQGLGIAEGAAATALRYAQERRQGGPAGEPAVPISEHADIQRILLSSVSRIDVLRGLTFEIAARLDSIEQDMPDAERRASSDLVQWMLPILKAGCSQLAFDTADAAIQVLGGAGYTKEWPVEQWMRDSRMMSIAEGSSGIQGLDLLHRRLWRTGGAGLQTFLAIARGEIGPADSVLSAPALAVLDELEAAGAWLIDRKESPREAEAGATAFLELATLAATGWIAVRLASIETTEDPIRGRLAAAGRYWLTHIGAAAGHAAAEVRGGAARLRLFPAISASSPALN